MFDFVYRRDESKPFSVYRLMNHRTGRYYIGSSAQVARRFAEHKSAILQINHHNIDIRNDSIWCDLNDWSFRLLSRHATHSEMVQRETLIIKIFVGRKSCYNASLNYMCDPVAIEWIVFNLKNGRFRKYLNYRSALRDLEVTSAAFTINSAGILQYKDYLIFKPGFSSISAKKFVDIDNYIQESLDELLSKALLSKFIYNQSLEETPIFEHFGRLPELLERDFSVKELLKPSGRLGIPTMKRSAIDGQVYAGNIRVTSDPAGDLVSLTSKGRCVALYLTKLKQEENRNVAKQVILTLSLIETQERRDLTATADLRQAAQLAKYHPGLLGELSQIFEGQYFLAVQGINCLYLHKFIVGEEYEQSLSKLSGFGEIFYAFQKVNEPHLYTDEIHICVVTRCGTIKKIAQPDQTEYKRKRVAWTQPYLIKGDSIVSIFRVTCEMYVAAITETGQVIIIDSNDVRPMGMSASGFRLVKDGSAPLSSACSVSKDGPLLAVTQNGFVLPFTAEGMYITMRGDRPRKLKNYKPEMGVVLWMMPLDRVSYLGRHIFITTSDGREIILEVKSILTDTCEKPLQLLNLLNGEVINAVNLV